MVPERAGRPGQRFVEAAGESQTCSTDPLESVVDGKSRQPCRIARKSRHTTVQTITNNRQWPHPDRMRIGTETKKEAIMKHSARVISLLMALSGAVVPGALAQTQPAQTPPAQPPPAATQTQQKQNEHPKAKGAAAGAAIGAATTGNAAKGAVVGAGHNRREERRTNRKNQ